MKATSLSVPKPTCAVVVIEKPVSRWNKLKSAATGRAKRAAGVVTGIATKVKQGIDYAKRSVDGQISRATGIDYEWSRAILTVGSAGSAIGGRRRTRRWLQQVFHDGPGHLACFKPINAYIDGYSRGRRLRGVGSWHRVQHGHSLEFLGILVRRFGAKAVPAYVIHLSQDFTTEQGIPVVPYAWVLRDRLIKCGLKQTTASACLSVNLASLIGAVGIVLIARELVVVGCEIYSAARSQHGTKLEAISCST